MLKFRNYSKSSPKIRVSITQFIVFTKFEKKMRHFSKRHFSNLLLLWISTKKTDNYSIKMENLTTKLYGSIDDSRTFTASKVFRFKFSIGIGLSMSFLWSFTKAKIKIRKVTWRNNFFNFFFPRKTVYVLHI